MNEVFQSIQALPQFSVAELEQVLQRFESRTIKKKTTLLEAGKPTREVHFIIQGCMRLYYEKDGQDISLRPTLYLPTHDGNAASRLDKRIFLGE
jgi:CRP-like cAMP-binding protein